MSVKKFVYLVSQKISKKKLIKWENRRKMMEAKYNFHKITLKFDCLIEVIFCSECFNRLL